MLDAEIKPSPLTNTEMNKQQSRKHQAAAIVPRLTRSKSGTSPTPTTTSSAASNSVASKLGAKEVIKRSNSATKLCKRSPFSSGNSNTNAITDKIIEPHRHEESKDDNFKLLQRTQSEIGRLPGRARSASTSPSAWALSTSRRTSISIAETPFSASPVVPIAVPKSPSSGKLKRELMSRNGVSGVLKFLKQKKVSPALEQEYHQFRLAHTRLLQWRFANARAEASTAVIRRLAQKKLFNVWVRISILRVQIVEERTEIQKLKQEIKLHHIYNSQFSSLKEWARLDAKNSEAVGRLTRKLSAVSTCLPLVHGAKADVTSIYETMRWAMRVMEGIKAMVAAMQAQVDKACYMLTKLTVLLKEHKHCLTELDKRLKGFSLLEVKEKSLRLHCIQLVKDSIIKE